MRYDARLTAICQNIKRCWNFPTNNFSEAEPHFLKGDQRDKKPEGVSWRKIDLKKTPGQESRDAFKRKP